MTPIAIDPIVQRDSSDCCVAALAMLTGKPYREVAEVALRLFPTALRRGLWTSELIRLAHGIGYRLVKTPREDDSTGVITFRRGRSWAHVAALFQGVVINPADGLVWDLDSFISAKTAIGPGTCR